LDAVTTEDLSHFNAYCPHCRRANRISRQELLRAAPDWEPQPPEEEKKTEEVSDEV
jgi:hypothetical protein